MTQPRSLAAIARDIRAHWPKVSPYAAPYLDAMSTLDTIHPDISRPREMSLPRTDVLPC